MANYMTYSDRAAFKVAIGISDTVDDARLLQVLERASRWIDNQTGRHFGVRVATRYYTPASVGHLLIDDLLFISSLATDEDDDLDYDYTWTSGDYLIEPVNGFPKTRIIAHPSGDYSFPARQPQSVKIVGLWGYGSADANGNGGSATPYEDSGATTAEELDASETAVDVSSGPLLAVGNTLLVESEQMYCTAVATNTATVKRGVNGTTAATHATGKAIYVYRYPDDVAEACMLRAAQLLYGINAPLNIMGALSEQQAFTPSMLYARIMDLVDPFRRVSVG